MDDQRARTARGPVRGGDRAAPCPAAADAALRADPGPRPRGQRRLADRHAVGGAAAGQRPSRRPRARERAATGASRPDPHEGPGYALAVEDVELDADRFEALVARGRTELGAGDAEAAGRTLDEALSLP